VARPQISPEQDPLVGTKYRAISLLGHGGMGEVFLADHVELGRTVVVKLIHPKYASREHLVDRMRLEAQALGALNHENIVSVTDAGRTPGGRAFIVMERLRGCTLHEELTVRGRIPLHTVLTYMRGVLSALTAAHAIGIVHRDVKSANIFLHETVDGRRVPKLLDFGIVKVLDGASSKALKPPVVPTEEGTVVGTPGYVSPEQALGKGVDARSDLYAAGVVLYQLIAGRGPFDEHGKGEKLIAAHVREMPDPPSKFLAEPVPPAVDAIVLKALEKDPSRRFQSAAEFERALGVLLDAWQKPVGWIPTMAFDGSEFAGPPPKDLKLPRPVAAKQKNSPAEPRQPPAREPPPTPTAVSPADDARPVAPDHSAVGNTARSEAPAAERDMRRAAAVFLLIAIVTAGGVAALIAWFVAGG
jgi:eukaryotic-like serine/threonine-protein kinase